MMKIYTISTTLVGEGDSITIITATSLGGRFWDFERKYLGAASARNVHETMSSAELLARFKLLSMDSSVTNRTAVQTKTTIFDPGIPGKTVIKDGEVSIHLMADSVDDLDVKVDIYQVRSVASINTTIAEKEKTTVVDNNAEELFEVLGKIC